VALIQREDVVRSETLSGGHDRGVGQSEVKIRVLAQQIPTPGQIFLRWMLQGVDPDQQVVKQVQFRSGPKMRKQQIVQLSEDGSWNHNGLALDFLDGAFNGSVIAIRFVVQGVESAGIGDYGHRPSLTACIRISSARSPTSFRPLE